MPAQKPTSPLSTLTWSSPATRTGAVLGMMNRVHYKLPRGRAASTVEMKSKWHATPNRKGFHMPDTESSCKAPEVKTLNLCGGSMHKKQRKMS